MDIKLDILNYYMHKLTEYELENFDNLTEIEIRNIVNRIWKSYLSENFTLGESFKFLGTFLSPIELIEDDVLDKSEGYISLINSENLPQTTGEMTLITDIDWTKADKVYLPIHFKNKSFYIKGGLNFKAFMVANIGEGIINSAVDYAKDNPFNLPFYNLDLRYYLKDIKPDYDQIVREVICYYIMEEYHKMDFKLRKELEKKYRKFITSSFSSMKDYCTGEEMLDFMFKHIKLKETKLDKQIEIW